MRTSIPGKLDHLPEMTRLSAFNGYRTYGGPVEVPADEADMPLAAYAHLSQEEVRKALPALQPRDTESWLTQMAGRLAYQRDGGAS